MKITKETLRQIIKEELESVLETSFSIVPDDVLNITMDNIKETMLNAYDDKIPPSLQEMIGLIADRKYETVRKELNRMREGLVQYHRDKGTTVPRSVIHSFPFIRNMLEYYKYTVPVKKSTNQ